jgi:hypothetical protein
MQLQRQFSGHETLSYAADPLLQSQAYPDELY